MALLLSTRAVLFGLPLLTWPGNSLNAGSCDRLRCTRAPSLSPVSPSSMTAVSLSCPPSTSHTMRPAKYESSCRAAYGIQVGKSLGPTKVSQRMPPPPAPSRKLPALNGAGMGALVQGPGGSATAGASSPMVAKRTARKARTVHDIWRHSMHVRIDRSCLCRKGASKPCIPEQGLPQATTQCCCCCCRPRCCH